MLLFDQNLSPEMPRLLATVFPGSRHVRECGLERAEDDAIWTTAANLGLAIVSKDSDFQERSFLVGPPPKVIWIQRGNCSTDDILLLLRESQEAIDSFLSAADAAMLELA